MDGFVFCSFFLLSDFVFLFVSSVYVHFFVSFFYFLGGELSCVCFETLFALVR